MSPLLPPVVGEEPDDGAVRTPAALQDGNGVDGVYRDGGMRLSTGQKERAEVDARTDQQRILKPLNVFLQALRTCPQNRGKTNRLPPNKMDGKHGIAAI